MFWKLAMLTTLGVGNYLGPTGLGLPTLPNAIPSAPLQVPQTDDDLRNEFRRFRLNDQKTPFRIHGGVGPASSSI